MAEADVRPLDEEATREVKRWLRSSVLDRSVSTPMPFLFSAYRAQGGRRSSAEFSDAIVRGCPGLTVRRCRGRMVVDGAAPRWDVETLRRLL